jgi:hypothetical protein
VGATGIAEVEEEDTSYPHELIINIQESRHDTLKQRLFARS